MRNWIWLFVLLSCCVKAPVKKERSEPEAFSNLNPVSSMNPEQLSAMHVTVKSCNACHTKDRPALPHDQTSDCIGCHSFPAFKSELSAFTHNPKPNSCVGCHEKDRPAAPHEAKMDCAGCHSFPSFKQAASFNHLPAPTACISCHEKDRPAAPHLANKDCVGCHAYPTFKRLAFSHTPKPAICEDCHARPSTVGRRAYPNQGPPLGFVANDPKALGGKHYVGKDCASCHRTPDEGATAFAFTHSVPKPDFCLPCHFNDGNDEHNNDGRAVLKDFGNCYSCHRNSDAAANRNWGRN